MDDPETEGLCDWRIGGNMEMLLPDGIKRLA
jgi:hypothetical protein